MLHGIWNTAIDKMEKEKIANHSFHFDSRIKCCRADIDNVRAIFDKFNYLKKKTVFPRWNLSHCHCMEQLNDVQSTKS